MGLQPRTRLKERLPAAPTLSSSSSATATAAAVAASAAATATTKMALLIVLLFASSLCARADGEGASVSKRARAPETVVMADVLLTDLAAAPGWKQHVSVPDAATKSKRATPRPLAAQELQLDLAKLNGTCWDYEEIYAHQTSRICPFQNITRKNARYASDQVDFVGAFEDLVAPATMIFSHGDVCAGEEKTSATVTFRCPRDSELNITAVVASEKEEFCKTSYVIKTPWACSIPDATPFEQSACRQKSQDLAALQQAVEAQFAAFVMPDLIAYIDSSIDALLQMLAQEATASSSSTSSSDSGSANPL